MTLISLTVGFFIISAYNLPFGLVSGNSDKGREAHNSIGTTPEIIKEYGYTVETHSVVSEDGYIMECHRIPHKKNSTKIGFPVLLEHGLFLDSSSYVLYGNKSLAFRLADEGFDVWLMNTRGNNYAENSSTKIKKFWDFSWHEMGIYDLPAHIDYVLNNTHHSEVLYLGMSMGTTTFFVTATQKPEYQKKIKGALLMAPLTNLKHLSGFLDNLSVPPKSLQNAKQALLNRQFIKKDGTYQKILKNLCNFPQLKPKVCKDLLLSLTGSDHNTTNEEVLQKYLAQYPSSTSTKSLVHYFQIIMSGKFRQFDYGERKNKEKYGNASPPEYDLTSISTPMSLFAGATDVMADPEGIKETLSGLRAVKSIYYIPCRHFNHMDFLLARNIDELVNKEVLKHLRYLMHPEKGIPHKNNYGPTVNPEQFPVCT